jgi:arginine utilization protein RocB
LQQFVDQVDVCHQHATAAIAPAAQLSHGIAIVNASLEKRDVLFVEIGNDLEGKQLVDMRSGGRISLRGLRARTLPQEKQRIGMIILMDLVC